MLLDALEANIDVAKKDIASQEGTTNAYGCFSGMTWEIAQTISN